VLCFHITCVSTWEFIHLRPTHWLEVLITCSLPVEIVSMVRQESLVAGLRYHFSPLDWEYGPIAKHS
jgi:hypothetical protein